MKMIVMSERSQLVLKVIHSFHSGSPSVKSRDFPLFLISLFKENQGGGVRIF